MMKSTRAKQLIKKLKEGIITPEEEKELLANPSVTDMMKKQWDNTPLETIDYNKSHFGETFKRVQEKTKTSHEPKYTSHKRGRSIRIGFSLLAAASIITFVLFIVKFEDFLSFSKSSETSHNLTEVYCSAGERMQISLADGTEVWLNSNSKISYPESFNGSHREVTLEGEAYFKVREDKKKPFVVYANDMIIRVLGTEFNVMSYADDDVIETTLVRGSVEVSLSKEIKTDFDDIRLKPDQKLEFSKNEKSLHLYKVNAEYYTAWKNGRLIFDNEPLSLIIRRLEKWYNIDISCPEELAEKFRFTLVVQDEPLERVLHLLSLTSPIEFIIKDNKVQLFEKKDKS